MPFSDHHLKSGPFDNWTRLDHSNTRLVQYSDGHWSEYLYVVSSPRYCNFVIFVFQNIDVYVLIITRKRYVERLFRQTTDVYVEVAVFFFQFVQEEGIESIGQRIACRVRKSDTLKNVVEYLQNKFKLRQL